MEKHVPKAAPIVKQPRKTSPVFVILAVILMITGIGFIIAGCHATFFPCEGIVDGVRLSEDISTIRGLALIIIGICSIILGLTSAVVNLLMKILLK